MFSRSEKKRSFIIKSSPSGSTFVNPQTAVWLPLSLCLSCVHSTLPFSPFYILFVFWWPFFWMGLKSSWHQRQCTVILDRAKHWHYKKTGYRPTQYLVIQGKNFLFVLQLHWGWNWRKRRFKSSGFTEFCLVGSYNRLLFSTLWCRKSSPIDKCFICCGFRF